jgi:hypothetical protein
MAQASTKIVRFMTAVALVGIARTAAAAPNETAPAKMAVEAFGRLSKDGVSAFSDVHLARLAIFDGRTDEAAKFVADAQASLSKAKLDDTVFRESEIGLTASRHDDSKAMPVPRVTSAIAWLPIGSEIALGETYIPTPESSIAVVNARKSLEKGDTGKALQTIRLAGIDIDYTVALAPLDRSVASIDKANAMIVEHDYYGASQALRRAEDGIRYDEFDDVGNVKNTSADTIVVAKRH